MSTKKQPAAVLPTEPTAPAKARTRKPHLVEVPAGIEEAALAKIERASPPKQTGPLNPRFAVSIGDDNTLTMSLIDVADHAGSIGLRGPTVAVQVLKGTLPSYHLDHSNTLDLRLLLANHIQPSLQTDTDRLSKITIDDLEGRLRDANAEHERAIAALVKDLDIADETVAGLQLSVEDLQRGLRAGERDAEVLALQIKDDREQRERQAVNAREGLAELRRERDAAIENATAASGKTAEAVKKVGELEQQLTAARARPPFLKRLAAVFFAPSHRRA